MRAALPLPRQKLRPTVRPTKKGGRRPSLEIFRNVAVRLLGRRRLDPSGASVPLSAPPSLPKSRVRRRRARGRARNSPFASPSDPGLHARSLFVVHGDRLTNRIGQESRQAVHVGRLGLVAAPVAAEFPTVTTILALVVALGAPDRALLTLAAILALVLALEILERAPALAPLLGLNAWV